MAYTSAENSRDLYTFVWSAVSENYCCSLPQCHLAAPLTQKGVYKLCVASPKFSSLYNLWEMLFMMCPPGCDCSD